MDEKKLVVINDDGTELEMEILFTFEDDTYNKNYVLYINPQDTTGEVFVSSYTEDGALNTVTDEKEWEMIEEVFNAFVIQHDTDNDDADEHECSCGCNHEHDLEDDSEHTCECENVEHKSCECGHEKTH